MDELVLYSEWERQRQLFDQLEKAFYYRKIKEDVERQSNEIANEYGLKAVLLPSRSVGVMGDYRVYGFTIMLEGLRVVQTDQYNLFDGEPIPKYEPDQETLAKISTKITNNVRDVTRVVISLAGAGESNVFIDEYFLKR